MVPGRILYRAGVTRQAILRQGASAGVPALNAIVLTQSARGRLDFDQSRAAGKRIDRGVYRVKRLKMGLGI